MGQALTIPGDAANVLREKVKTIFLDLLPDNKLDEMVKGEWDRFFNDQPKRDTYGNIERGKTVPSEFSKVIKDVLKEEIETRAREQLRAKIDEIIDWNGNTQNADLFAEIVNKVAPDLVKQVAAQFVANTLTNMRNNGF